MSLDSPPLYNLSYFRQICAPSPSSLSETSHENLVTDFELLFIHRIVGVSVRTDQGESRVNVGLHSGRLAICTQNQFPGCHL